ncbi:MAG: Glu/Leu/Phe/Val dehydrogenase dimerization domain-containing protein [Pseudobdellovibrionaceae bacterium]
MLKSTTLDVSNHPSFDAHEQVVAFEDEALGLKAIIAVHNTNLGPALGGCRIYPYAHQDDAINDVLRLSRGMTYKSALAGLPLGGGKAVIIGNPKTIKSAQFMERFGEAIESLKGAYITAEDVGSTEEDMLAIARKTSYVAGLPEQEADGTVNGNPSPVTAYGVYHGIKAACNFLWDEPSLEGRNIAIQGLGAVGYALARYVVKEGAKITVADINEDAIARAKIEFGENIVVTDSAVIHAADVDIFAPCALGAGLNDTTIPQIRAKIIAGAANNQLAQPCHDDMIKNHGILYAPDYAVNSGGITSVGYEYFARTGRNPYHHPLDHSHMMQHVERIEDVLKHVFIFALNRNIGTGEAANMLAEEIFKGSGVATVSSAA